MRRKTQSKLSPLFDDSQNQQPEPIAENRKTWPIITTALMVSGLIFYIAYLHQEQVLLARSYNQLEVGTNLLRDARDSWIVKVRGLEQSLEEAEVRIERRDQTLEAQADQRRALEAENLDLIAELTKTKQDQSVEDSYMDIAEQHRFNVMLEEIRGLRERLTTQTEEVHELLEARIELVNALANESTKRRRQTAATSE